jgi:Protein of unknown function (DUF3060)
MRFPDSITALVLIGVCLNTVPLGARQREDTQGLKAMPCTGETTRIDGMEQRLRLTGDCRTVVVSGTGNRIVIERVATINVSGIGNEIRWESSLQGDAPRVISSGLKNVVTRVQPAKVGTGGNPGPAGKPRSAPPPRSSPPPTSPPATTTPPSAVPAAEAPPSDASPLRVRQSGQSLRLDCASRAVSVSGHTNVITLTGTCTQVSVSGSGNKITVERTPRIVTTGHNNEIVWEHGDNDKQPAVRNTGGNNTIRRASS